MGMHVTGESLVGCDGVPLRGWNFTPGQDHLPSDSHNSDIAGIGVGSCGLESVTTGLSQLTCPQIAIGFSAAAYISFILVVMYYIFGYVEPPFSNAVDHGCLELIWKRASKRPSKIWEPFLRKAILVYSDTQLVTGLALLGSLFAQLCVDLPSYYWQIGVYLAWFSSHTHLTSITILRRFLRDHPPIRLWRVVLMLAMVSMLAIALLPTGDSHWMVDHEGHFLGGVPAICHFKRLQDASDFSVLKTQGFTMLVSYLILFFGYATRILKLSAKATETSRQWLRVKPGNIMRGKLDAMYIRYIGVRTSRWWFWPYVLLETLLIVGKACLDAWESTLWEVRRGTTHLSC